MDVADAGRQADGAAERGRRDRSVIEAGADAAAQVAERHRAFEEIGRGDRRRGRSVNDIEPRRCASFPSPSWTAAMRSPAASASMWRNARRGVERRLVANDVDFDVGRSPIGVTSPTVARIEIGVPGARCSVRTNRPDAGDG